MNKAAVNIFVHVFWIQELIYIGWTHIVEMLDHDTYILSL